MKMSSEKKKIFGVILSFLLVLSMSVPVMAEDENYPRYLDDAGLLSSSQAQKLEKKLDKISKEHHCDVVIAVANTTTAHADSMEELQKKPVFDRLIREKRFERYVLLGNEPQIGTIQEIYDERGSLLYQDQEEKTAIC